MSNSTPPHVFKDWNVSVSIDEYQGRTRATAWLRWRDQEAVGIGLAKLNPADRYLAEIADDLAVARALSDLARRMMSVTAHHIETVTEKPVTSLH